MPLSQMNDKEKYNLQEKSSSNVKKLSVLLSSQLHLRAKRYALQTDQTLTDLITSLLCEFLDNAEATQQKKGSPE